MMMDDQYTRKLPRSSTKTFGFGWSNTKFQGDQLASTDRISSSAHQSGESLGVAASGEIAITALNLEVTSFMVGLLLGSGLMQAWMISQMIFSSSSLWVFKLGSTKEPTPPLPLRYSTTCCFSGAGILEPLPHHLVLLRNKRFMLALFGQFKRKRKK